MARLFKVACIALVTVPIVYLIWALAGKLDKQIPKDAPFVKYPVNFVELSAEEAGQAVKNDSAYINWLELGMVYYKTGMDEEGTYAFTEAVKRFPQSTYAHLKLCELYNRKGDYENAIIHCNEALRLKPAYELAKYQKQVAEHRMAGETDWQ